MTRNQLVDMVWTGSSIVRRFLEEGDPAAPGSYEDWNERDLLGHLVGWMEYSIDKLTSIKLGTAQSQEYAHARSLEEINRILYDKTKDAPRQGVESAYLAALGGYLKVISLFSDGEINLDSFDTGYKTELWRYMLLDTVIHPLQHVLYHYLKAEKYGKLREAIARTKDIFALYSADGDGYKLSEFGLARPEFQARLSILLEAGGADDELGRFVRLNKA